MLNYAEFLDRKSLRAAQRGMEAVPGLAGHLFPFQRRAVEFALRCGASGEFLDTGLGKTACELEWCRHAAEASNGLALILTPLAVARQIEREAARWGYDCRVIRSQNDARPGINVCNYDRLDALDTDAFGAVALDESSILKNFTGKTSRRLIESFAGHRWKLSATATPAPNDHMELGTHSDFCGALSSNEMLSRFFINDTSQASQVWRLKRHGVAAFWDWMASWAVMATMPSDMGDSDEGFILPPIKVHRHESESIILSGATDLFGSADLSATSIHAVKRQTAETRAKSAAGLATSNDRPWVVWCDTDYESAAIMSALNGTHGVVEVRGSFDVDRKESAIAGFSDGTHRVIVTKPSVCGFGLNWQHCSDTVFVGRSFSYEAWYQAIRRLWRFGQTRQVDCHIVVAEGEQQIGRVIDRKATDHASMKTSMRDAMRRALGLVATRRIPYVATHKGRLPSWM